MEDDLQISMNFKKCIVEEWEKLSKEIIKNYINLCLKGTRLIKTWLPLLNAKEVMFEY